MRDRITVATGHYTDANGVQHRIRVPVADEAHTDAIRAQYAEESADGYVYLRTDAVYGPEDIPKASDTHFFDTDTMRFFRSRIGSKWDIVGNRLYFFTTEQNGHDPRMATVRVWKADTDTMDTIGEFGQYASPRTAYRAMVKAAEAYAQELAGVTT